MELVILWVLLGWASAAVANSKGHEGCSWFIGGTFLGLFALIAALTMRANEAGLEAQALRRGARKCPRCAEIIKAEAVVCRYCGADLPARREPSAS